MFLGWNGETQQFLEDDIWPCNPHFLPANTLHTVKEVRANLLRLSHHERVKSSFFGPPAHFAWLQAGSAAV